VQSNEVRCSRHYPWQLRPRLLLAELWLNQEMEICMWDIYQLGHRLRCDLIAARHDPEKKT